MSFQHPEYEIASYTEDNTLYTFQLELDMVTEKLETWWNSLIRWFKENLFKGLS